MPPSDAPSCAHEWEQTDINLTTCGRRWIQGRAVAYCPRCRKFGGRSVMFLDGGFFKTAAEAQAANQEAWDRYNAEKVVWLREHHPDHVEEEAR